MDAIHKEMGDVAVAFDILDSDKDQMPSDLYHQDGRLLTQGSLCRGGT